MMELSCTSKNTHSDIIIREWIFPILIIMMSQKNITNTEMTWKTINTLTASTNDVILPNCREKQRLHFSGYKADSQSMGEDLPNDLCHKLSQQIIEYTNGKEYMFGIFFSSEEKDTLFHRKRSIPECRAFLKLHGIPFERHHARRIEKEDYDAFDEIYVIDMRYFKLNAVRFMQEQGITQLYPGHYHGDNPETVQRLQDEIRMAREVLSGKRKGQVNEGNPQLNRFVHDNGVYIRYRDPEGLK